MHNEKLDHTLSPNKLWQADSLHHGYQYFLEPSRTEDIEELYPLIDANEIMEAWHLHHIPLLNILALSIEQAHIVNTQIQKELRKQGQEKIGTQKKPLALTFSLFRMDMTNSLGIKEIIGIGGLNPLASMGYSVAEVWFVGENMDKHARFLVGHGKQLLAMFFEYYPILINVVGTWNKRNIAWLRSLGFIVENTPQNIGKSNALFHRFYHTKHMFEHTLP